MTQLRNICLLTSSLFLVHFEYFLALFGTILYTIHDDTPLQAYRARSRECIPANEAGLWRAPDRDGAVTLILQRISNIHQFSLSLSNSQFSGLQRPPLSPSAEPWLRICQFFELPNQATRKLFVHHITSHHSSFQSDCHLPNAKGAAGHLARACVELILLQLSRCQELNRLAIELASGAKCSCSLL